VQDYAFHQLVKQRRLVMKLRSTYVHWENHEVVPSAQRL